MPELPEVETIKRLLETQLINKRILKVDILREKTIVGDAKEFKDRLEGKKFLSISRIGKYLIFHLENNLVILSHLRMEGKYYQYHKDEENSKHARVVFYLDDETKMIYDDSRCFGILKLTSEDSYKNEDEIAKLGPEPFDIKDVNYLINKTKKSSLPIKSALLDQTIMTGLGNIYVDETLFKSKVHPLKKASKVSKKEWEDILYYSVETLNEAIKEGGSTIHSYHPGKGIDGNFQVKLLCYGHKGDRCPRCNASFHFIKVGGRGTTFCPMCQIEKKDKLIIGVTGKIASGKSTLNEILKEEGYPVISSDEIVEELYKNDVEIRQKIEDILGLSFTCGYVDKDVLRTHLSKHKNDIKKLNKIVHPRVREIIEDKVNNIERGFVFVEVPLLYESKMEDLFDFIIATNIDNNLQIERLKKRNKSSYNELSLINSNNKFDEYSKVVDFLIDNNGDINSLKNKVMEIINKLQSHLN